MNNFKNITEHQLVNELRSRIKECKATLLSLLDDWHYFQNILQPRLMFVYETFFGDLEYELQNKTRVAAELERRIELLHYKIKKGEKITRKTLDFIDKLINQEFDQYRGDSENIENPDLFTQAAPSKEEQIENVINDLDVGYIYRQIVKKLHPDINGYTEEFKKYWDNVQDAYKHSNKHRLRMFFKTLCVDENGFIDNNKNEELKLRNEVRELEINIAMEQRKIDRLKRQEPFVFEQKLNDFSWIERRQKLLKDRITVLDQQIQENESLLRALTAKPAKQKEYLNFGNNARFQEGFFQTAYGV